MEQMDNLTEPESKTEIDELAGKFSVLLNKAMERYEVRRFLKDKVIRKVDGDYNVLYTEIRNKRIEYKSEQGKIESITFEDLLVQQNTSGRISAINPDFLQSLISVYPILQIAVPETATYTAEDWDTQNIKPSIAILESDFDETTTQYVRGYDPDGNEIIVDAFNEPNNLFLVIGASERVIAISKTDGSIIAARTHVANLIFEDENYYYYDRALYEGSVAPTVEINSGSGTISPCRTWGDAEFLYQINCTDIKSYEHWIAGAPELRLQVFSPEFSFSSLIHTGEMEPRRRRDIKDKWWTKEVQLFKWSERFTGEGVVFFWYEVDGGARTKEIKLNAGYTKKDGTNISASTTIEIGKRDDKIGHLLITVDDCRQGSIYDLVSIKWKTKIK